jgi:hypothetical protein
MGYNMNEGITEYLTQKAVSKVGYAPTSSYPNQLAVARKLAAIVGDEKIEKAYFEGNVDGLKAALNSAKKASSFDDLAAAMKQDPPDYVKADDALK